MAYFPFFIDLKGRKGLVYGGGLVAFRKISALLEFEADITIIAPSFCEEITALKDRVDIRTGVYRREDIEGAYFVIAATGDPSVNTAISAACRDKGILVNVVDVLEECGFLFPSYIKHGKISIGVTTSGSSPVMAAQIRKTIEKNLPDFYEEVVDTLGSYRGYIKEIIPLEHKRAEIFKELAAVGMDKGKLTPEDVQIIIEKHRNA